MILDVAVVGAGIAGSAAVVALTRAGLRVAWIAPAPAADYDPVGETLSPAANPILARLGLAEVLDTGAHRRSNVTLSSWGGEQLVDRNAILHLEGPGLVLDRRRFEADLRAAAGAVATRHHPCGLLTAEPAEEAWRLTLEDGVEVSARALVDASGRAAVAARHWTGRARADQLVALHAFLDQRDEDVEPTPAVLIEAVESGWWYAALRPGGTLSVAYFTDPDLLDRTPTRDMDYWRLLISASRFVGRWVEDAGFAVDAAPRLSSAGTTWLDRAAGRQAGAPWMAIGDCAAAFDPLSSFGMTTALWAAERSAEVMASALGGKSDDLDGYDRAVRSGVDQFLAQRRDMYAREGRFADAPFWRRRADEN